MHERLAAPGAATVHLGWLVRAERVVAVKRLHSLHAGDEVGVARARRDARQAMGVEHPNVVATLGVVRRSDEVLAAMDYVAGASLAELVDAAPEGLEPGVAMAIAAGALRGLDAVHQARSRMGSRSVAPGRVLVGEDGRARVLDLDVPGPRAASAVLGELPYASPEQLRGGGVDARRDVYALSVVLWEMLSGRALFREASPAGMLQAILDGAVPAPSLLAPRINGALDAIVLQGLARDPRARFASAGAMADALAQAGHASEEDVARVLAGMDLPCIWRRRARVEDVRRREGRLLHFECTRSASNDRWRPSCSPARRVE